MLTPLHTLSLYNAVANGGVYIEPRIVREVREANKVIKSFDDINSFKIAKKSSINTVKELLRGV